MALNHSASCRRGESRAPVSLGAAASSFCSGRRITATACEEASLASGGDDGIDLGVIDGVSGVGLAPPGVNTELMEWLPARGADLCILQDFDRS